MLGRAPDSLGNGSLGLKDSFRRIGAGKKWQWWLVQRGAGSVRREQSVWRRMRSESKAMV